ncbi:MAG: hypothetical protein U0136_21745 [Bdellovibrionota bacterium]
MKKVFCVAMLSLAGVLPLRANADCTRDDAFNKMMKMNQLSTKLQSEVPLDPRVDGAAMNSAADRIKAYADMMAPSGQLLAEGKYNDACALYDKVAAHFGFELDKSNALTMDDLRKNNGKKKAGDCDIVEMAKRNAALANDFKAAYDAGKFTYERQREYSKDSEKLNMLATSDPGAACREIDALRAKYGL